jgi:hypothetical protein
MAAMGLSARMVVVAFPFVVATVLLADSPAGARAGIDGQRLNAILVPAFLVLQLAHLPPTRRVLVLLVVPVTAVGEVLLSVVFGLYRYRLDAIPLYVPFGHAVLVAATLLMTTSSLVVRHEPTVRAGLLSAYAALVATAVMTGDTFSVGLALPFAIVLWRSGGRLFYLLMGAAVMYVECTGAVLGTWRWVSNPFGVLHTNNPPLVVYAIYLVGDVGLVRLARLIETRRAAAAAVVGAKRPLEPALVAGTVLARTSPVRVRPADRPRNLHTGPAPAAIVGAETPSPGDALHTIHRIAS